MWRLFLPPPHLSGKINVNPDSITSSSLRKRGGGEVKSGKLITAEGQGGQEPRTPPGEDRLRIPSLQPRVT